MIKNNNSKSNEIDWNEIIKRVKVELLPYQQQGFAPSLRTMLYRLYSKKVLPNTKYAYKHLSSVTARARIDRRLPINCFSDDTRRTIKNFNQNYRTLDEIINNDYLDKLKKLPEEYTKLIPRWYKQPEYIEVWNEKDAMSGTFQSILNGKDVEIVPNKGFSSLTFLWKNMKRLNRWDAAAGKKIHVLYFGDFDPSGEEMDRDLRNRIDLLEKYQHTYIRFDEIDFQRIAVKKEHIRKYNLPISIDAETQEKLDKDTRTNGFKKRHGGELYAVELDALPAIVPDVFKTMVIKSVDQYFDEDIYEENMEGYSVDHGKKLLKQKLKQFLKELR